MKKITCFISSLAAGGAEHQLVVLANLLSEKGYDVDFVTCLEDEDYYQLNSSINHIKIPSGNSNFVSGLKMLWYFRTVNTDVVISFRERMNLTSIAGCLGRNIKLIAGERSFTVNKPTLVGYLVQKFLYRFADYIVANSYSQAQYLRNLKKSWANRVRTIINYTDLNEFDISSEPKDDSVIKFGVFARFSHHKNCLNFIKMLSILRLETNTQFEVHWYGQRKGKINDSYYANVLKCIDDYNVGDIFKIHDAVTNVPVLMKDFHAMVLPSFFEGFSNSIAEGICCGKPMLVSDVSDNSVMVHEGENGFLYNPSNIQSMIEAFKKFLSLTKDERLKMSSNSRKIAENLFEAEKFVNSYIELIES